MKNRLSLKPVFLLYFHSQPPFKASFCTTATKTRHNINSF